jgi:hypothetical protein
MLVEGTAFSGTIHIKFQERVVYRLTVAKNLRRVMARSKNQALLHRLGDMDRASER